METGAYDLNIVSSGHVSFEALLYNQEFCTALPRIESDVDIKSGFVTHTRDSISISYFSPDKNEVRLLSSKNDHSTSKKKHSESHVSEHCYQLMPSGLITAEVFTMNAEYQHEL